MPMNLKKKCSANKFLKPEPTLGIAKCKVRGIIKYQVRKEHITYFESAPGNRYGTLISKEYRRTTQIK